MQERIDHESPAKENMSGGDFLAVMLRRKWVVLLFTLVGVGAGWLSYKHSAPVYQARAQVLINRREPAIINNGLNRNDYEESVSRDILLTQSLVIRSELVVSEAVKNFKLTSLRSFAGGNATVPSVTATVIRGLAVTKGGDNLSTEDANVLNVTYRGMDMAECPKILKAVLESYQVVLGEDSKAVSEQSLELFQHVQEVLDRELRQLEGEYNEWRKSAPLIFSGNGEGVNPHYARLADIEGARSKSRLSLSAIRAHVQTIEEALKSGVLREALKLLVERSRGSRSESKSSSSAMVEQQLFQHMMDEQLLIEQYGEDHPKIKTLRKQIQVLQDLLLGSKGGQDAPTSPAQFLSDYLDSQRLEMKELEMQDRELSQAYEVEREAAKEALNFEVDDESWRAKITRKKQLWEEAIARLHQLQVVKDVQDYAGFKTKILAEPRDAVQVEPVPVRSMAVFGVFGMIVGIALAYMIDLADKSFRTPDEIRGQLRLPVIGHIPVIDNVLSRREKKNMPKADARVNEMIACYHRPRSTVAEAYRSIRTALYFGTRGEEHKVIQVTSADAGDGKTTLVCNLAVSIAQSGKKVCLVDADFRRSRLHEMFSVDRTVGISTVMMGTSELTDSIQQTSVENLYLLPCGPRPKNPSELLTSVKFKELLDVLRTKFDTVLIDTPPLLAVTDPCAVAPRADAVLLVMRITKHVRPNAQRAKELLDALEAKVLGVVVNGVEVRQGYGHDSGYRRYGYGGYGYREYDYGDYYADDDDDGNELSPTVVPTGSTSPGSPPGDNAAGGNSAASA